MPAVSKKQQRFFGMVRAAQKGEAKAPSPEVSRVASSIKKKDAKDFASTKHKGLPMKKKGLSEEGYDRMRDAALEKGTWKGGGGQPSTGGAKKTKGKTALQKETEKKYGKGKSAIDIVKKNITDKYGKGAIMKTKNEGTSYGIYKGDGKPKGAMSAFSKDKKENPYSLKNKLKMVIKGAAEKNRKKAGVTSEAVYTGPDKKDRAVIKKMDNKDFAKKAAEYEKNMDPKKRQALKDKATKGMKFTHEEAVSEAKYEAGASDYGKASIRNKRAFGKGGNAADPKERGGAKMLRHDSHTKRRGVKKNNKYGATNKPPVDGAPSDEFKKDRYASMRTEAKVDMKTPDYKRATVRDKRYGNPHGSLELGGGIRKDRRADHEAKRGVKTKGVKEEKSYYIDKEAEKRGRAKEARQAANKYAAKERAAAKRRAERNSLRRQGKTGAQGKYYVTKHMEREGVEPVVYWSSKALDQLEKINERQKDSDGQRLSQERGRSNYGKASVRNMRATGTGGNAADPAERLVAMDARHKAHKEKRGVKKEDKAYGKRAVLKMLIKSVAERERKKAGVTKEGTSYGIFKGDGKPKGVYDLSKKKKDKKKEVKEAKSAAWQRKEGKNKEGGLNEKGRKSYERENPGSDLKAPVTHKAKAGTKAGNRQKQFCARMSGVEGPMKDEKGRPTRKALALKKWKCGTSEDWKPFGKFIIDSVQSKESFYGSQEKVSEKVNQEVDQTETLTAEATRYDKEKGTTVKGGTKKPTSPKTKDAALDFVKAKYAGQIMRSGSNQAKKVKGAKSTAGTNKYKDAADKKKATASDAKKRGFKSTQNYVDTMARYGGKKNYDKGRGLGT